MKQNGKMLNVGGTYIVPFSTFLYLRNIFAYFIILKKNTLQSYSIFCDCFLSI